MITKFGTQINLGWGPQYDMHSWDSPDKQETPDFL